MISVQERPRQKVHLYVKYLDPSHAHVGQNGSTNDLGLRNRDRAATVQAA